MQSIKIPFKQVDGEIETDKEKCGGAVWGTEKWLSEIPGGGNSWASAGALVYGTLWLGTEHPGSLSRRWKVGTDDPCGLDIWSWFCTVWWLSWINVHSTWLTEGMKESWTLIKSSQKLWVGNSYPVVPISSLRNWRLFQLLLLFINNYYFGQQSKNWTLFSWSSIPGCL